MNEFATIQQREECIQSESIEFVHLHGFDSADLIGKGSYGRVYKVMRKGICYAAKVMEVNAYNSGFPVSTLREVSTLKRLSGHQNIVKVIDVQMNQAPHFVLLEFVQYSMQSYVNTKGAMTDRLNRICTLQVLRGIEHMHKMCTMHRDIKPGNILMQPSGHVMIADMGSSKVDMSGKSRDSAFFSSSNVSSHTTRVCTVPYSAPEVAANGEPTFSMDLWSVGCCTAFCGRGDDLFRSRKWEQHLHCVCTKLGMPSEHSTLANLPFFAEIDKSSWQIPPFDALSTVTSKFLSASLVSFVDSVVKFEQTQRENATSAQCHHGFTHIRNLSLLELLSYKGPLDSIQASNRTNGFVNSKERKPTIPSSNSPNSKKKKQRVKNP
jgi:serine/threonine protein kinase